MAEITPEDCTRVEEHLELGRHTELWNAGSYILVEIAEPFELDTFTAPEGYEITAVTRRAGQLDLNITRKE